MNMVSLSPVSSAPRGDGWFQPHREAAAWRVCRVPVPGRLVCGGCGRRQHSLRVYLVDRAVHAHCGAEPRQLLVHPEARQDGCQGRCTQVG